MRPSSSFIVLLTSLAGVAVGLAACSDDSTPSSSSSSSGSSSGGSSSGGTDGGVAAEAAAPVNGCTGFVDRSGASDTRAITWDINVTQTPERCMQIKVGQTVKWTSDGATTPADFTMHPLSQQGGDKPNPVLDVDEATGDVTFTASGTYGFVCGIHPLMVGAIKVVP